jgi:hypothetical protein
MSKAEIIAKTLRAMNLNPLGNEPPSGDEPEAEEFIASILQDRRSACPDIDIKTCENFRHLNGVLRDMPQFLSPL